MAVHVGDRGHGAGTSAYQNALSVRKVSFLREKFQLKRSIDTVGILRRLEVDVMDIKAIVLGGLVPAVLLGISTCLMKLSLRHGVSISTHLVLVGAMVLIVGLVATFAAGKWQLSIQSGFASAGMGLVWACSVMLMAYGMSKLQLPVSIVAPISNSNALVAVLLSAVLFKEWETLDVTKVLLGTCLIVAGASVVSAANTQG